MERADDLIVACDVSCDDLAKGLFALFAKTIASFKSVCLWTPFLVNLGPVHADFSSVDFGAVFGPLCPKVPFELNALPVYVSGR